MKEFYKKQVSQYGSDHRGCKGKLNFISNLRLLIVLATLFGIFYFHFYVSEIASWVVLIVGVVLFITFVKIHSKLNQRYKYLTALLDINQRNIDRIDGKWLDFAEDGKEFMDKDHSYTWDLDIFGKGSLFQYINMCVTKKGKEKLGKALWEPLGDIDKIYLIQEAVKETAEKLNWRQEVQGLATLLSQKNSIKDDHFSHRNSFYLKTPVVFTVNILPIITIVSLVLAYGFGLIDKNLGLALTAFQSLLTLMGIRVRGNSLNQLALISDNLSTYADILRVIEEENFSSPFLVNLQKQLMGNNKEKASTLIRNLGKISEKASNRRNLFFFPINIILLWDYRCIIEFERWKMQVGNILEIVENTIGEIEFVNTLGQLYKDNPNWSFPKFSKGDPRFIAQEMAHPLIIPQGVSNNALLDNNNPMLLITGSNMSGKSTYLRTVGVNMVLAYAGAPVCAKSLELSIFDLHTCMRISDNLEKGISSFYGELLRIKDILKSISKDERTKFVLLDEIFKGTNSYDRHIGAKALVKQLLKTGCYGLISTHDLELEVLEKETGGKTKNYHFKEHYENNEIKFDYRLREGISKTRNALYLLKLVGIELN